MNSAATPVAEAAAANPARASATPALISAGAIEWLGRAYDAGYRDYGLLEPDPILAALNPDATFREILDRMRRDVETQRTRARARGLLDLDVLLAPSK